MPFFLSVVLSINLPLLFNIARFTEWPDEAFTNSRNNIVVCIFHVWQKQKGVFSITSELRINRRPLELRAIDSVTELTACHLLYIHKTNSNNHAAIIERIENQPILTVSNIVGFIRDGGMIELREKDKRISIAVNLPAISKAQIKISSELLKIASTYPM